MNIFETVASMKLSALVAGQLVETKGYYSPGDGGEARYLIVPSQTADGYGDHTLSGGTVATLQTTGVLNARQFGATGDGTTDDTLALQAAITATDILSLDVSSISLFIPDGNYRYDFLRLPARAKTKGESMHNTVLRRIDGATDTESIQEISSAVKTQIFDLTIAGNDQPGTLLDLGNVTGNPSAFSTNAKLDNLLIRDSGGQGLVINGNVALFGFVNVINCGTSPAVKLTGSAGSYDRLEIFNTLTDITALECSDSRSVFDEIYIEGRFASPVVKFTSTAAHVKHLQINLTENLGVIADSVLLDTGSNRCVFDHIYNEERSGTTVTNILRDVVYSRTFTTALYGFNDVAINYSQAFKQLGAFTSQPHAQALLGGYPYGILNITTVGITRLPPVGNALLPITFVNSSGGTSTIGRANSDPAGTLVGGIADEYPMTVANSAITFHSDGTDWFAISSFGI